MDRLFLSYARKDSDFAKKLATDLKKQGIELWMDQLDISPGARWDDAVAAALKDADTILVLLSPSSVTSQNVLDEIAYALDNKKRIVPVVYRNCEIPFRIGRLHRVELAGDYQESFESLVSSLRTLNGKPIGEDGPSSERGRRGAQFWLSLTSRRIGLTVSILMGITAVLLVGRAVAPRIAGSPVTSTSGVTSLPTDSAISADSTNRMLPPARYVPTHVQVTATDQAARGVDASEHVRLDWDALLQGGVTFIFLRATYGSNRVDREFASRWKEAKVRGIVRGAYHFYRVDQPPEEQANAYLSHVRLEAGDLPAVLDLETNPFVQSPASPVDIIFGMSNWLARVEAVTGRKPIIYTGKQFSAETYKSMKSLSSYPLWIAHYGEQLSQPPVPENWDTWTFWQHAGSPIDLNRFNGTVLQLRQFAGMP